MTDYLLADGHHPGKTIGGDRCDAAGNQPPAALSLRGLRNPHGLVQSWFRHNKMNLANDRDEIESDLFYGIARAVATYRPMPDGMSITRWCWIAMNGEFRTGRTRRARYETRRVLTPLDGLDDPEWLQVHTIDPGFKQVEDRLTIQRWADEAHLTDAQADLLSWMAVHGGTYAQRTGEVAGDKSLFTALGGSSTMKAGLAKLQRVATTGKPWTPAKGRQARCGTESGYTAHRRNGEDACEPCKAARREAYHRRKGAA